MSIYGEDTRFQELWDDDLDLAAHVHRLLQAGERNIYRRVCEASDRVILGASLRHTRGNQLQASQLLGISRTTLRAKMTALGMFLEKQAWSKIG